MAGRRRPYRRPAVDVLGSARGYRARDPPGQAGQPRLVDHRRAAARAASASPRDGFRRFICNQWAAAESCCCRRGVAGVRGGTGVRARRADRGRGRYRRRTRRLGGHLDQRGLHVGADAVRRSSGARDRGRGSRTRGAVHDRRGQLRSLAGGSDRPGARAAGHQGLGVPATRRADDPGLPAAV